MSEKTPTPSRFIVDSSPIDNDVGMNAHPCAANVKAGKEAIMNTEDEVLEVFTRRMREARIASRQCRISESKGAYREAAEYARQHGREAEAHIADAAVLQLNQQLLLAQELLKRVLLMSELKLVGLAHFYLGSGQQGLGDGDAAIQSYQRALRDRHYFNWDGWAKNNLGIQHELRAAANREISERERESDEKEALKYYEYYKKALRDDGTPTYIQKYNHGRMCLKRGQDIKAVRLLREAHEEACDLRPPDWSSCGMIGRDLGTGFVSFIRSLLSFVRVPHTLC